MTATNPPARSGLQRKQDALRRLEQDIDAWVASADPERGTPHLVPLSFLWDGSTLLIAIPAASRTSRNLQATGRTRIGVGHPRDVVLIEGTAEALTVAELPAKLGEAFVLKAGFDPRPLDPPYLFFRIRPLRLQAWREVNEIEGRDLMRNGAWIVRDN